ncbi:MAG: hypothetical protein DBX55_07875 [Verrucomicrobia bacterium]|nr:MAG: hypothetical protein DBX55_07875 [Verrucomicrobiota bacterium]
MLVFSSGSVVILPSKWDGAVRSGRKVSELTGKFKLSGKSEFIGFVNLRLKCEGVGLFGKNFAARDSFSLQ